MDSKDTHATNTAFPPDQALFHRVATPPERIKASKKVTATQCTVCSTIRHKLLTCQRCQSMWYCSKECQKKDWPNHKPLCTSADRPKGMRKLVETFVCNSTVNSMLQVCAALDLDLANDETKEIGFKVPFMIRADIAVEPTDVRFLAKLLADAPIPDKTEGMIQLNHFEAHIPGRSGHPPLTSTCDLLWRNARERLDSLYPARRTEPLGLIEFGNDSELSITVSLPISPVSVQLARDSVPFVGPSRSTAGATEESMALHMTMEFINVHIRSDQQNQLKLRTEMTEKDKGIVRGAGVKSPIRRAAFLLREKLAREAIYANISLD